MLNFNSVDACKTINAVPHFQWGVQFIYKLNAQLFRHLELQLHELTSFQTDSHSKSSYLSILILNAW